MWEWGRPYRLAPRRGETSSEAGVIGAIPFAPFPSFSNNHDNRYRRCFRIPPEIQSPAIPTRA